MTDLAEFVALQATMIGGFGLLSSRMNSTAKRLESRMDRLEKRLRRIARLLPPQVAQ